jgi:hypothetical protein
MGTLSRHGCGISPRFAQQSFATIGIGANRTPTRRNAVRFGLSLKSAEPTVAIWVVAMRQKAQEEGDRQILTLSIAVLGLSLTFYKEVLKNQIGNNGWLLLVAWAGWSVAILSIVISMYLSARASGLKFNAIDAGLRYFFSNGSDSFSNRTRARTQSFDKWSWRLRSSSQCRGCRTLCRARGPRR